MLKVRVTDVSHVSLFLVGSAHPEPIKLSFFDTNWITLRPVQHLFLYHTGVPLAPIVKALKDSLSRTLPRFYSLAGRLTHIPETSDIVISFSGGEDDGVNFSVAEAEGVDLHRLADDEKHDVEGFSSLVPPLDHGELPAPVFSVQVTQFAGVGVAVGFSVSHTAVDGKAMWQFVEAWASDCRKTTAVAEEDTKQADVEPVLYRSVIRQTTTVEIANRMFVRDWANGRFMVPKPNSLFPDMSRRTFVISELTIGALRDRGTVVGAARPSAFVALSAHAWLSILRARAIPPDDQTVTVTFFMDMRSLLIKPPAGDSYFGNCVRPRVVQAKAKEVLGHDGEEGLRVACTKIGRAIEECRREPQRDCENWFSMARNVQRGDRYAVVVASPRMRVYEADFGWGRPRRVEMVSMNWDGEVALVGARDDPRAVQASVKLSTLRMDDFASLFLGSQPAARLEP